MCLVTSYFNIVSAGITGNLWSVLYTFYLEVMTEIWLRRQGIIFLEIIFLILLLLYLIKQ